MGAQVGMLISGLRRTMQIPNTIALPILAALLATPSLAQRKLTALDYYELEQLMNRYGHTIDTCSNNGYDYADLYTPDGKFVDKFSPNGFAKGGVVLAEGREALAEVVGGGKAGCKKPADGGMATPTNGGSVAWNGWSHVMANHVITPTAEGATGRVYLLMLGVTGPGSITRDGGYEDIYVKTRLGWRIKQRTHVRTRAWHNPTLQTPELQEALK
jgi:hypothetical protein